MQRSVSLPPYNSTGYRSANIRRSADLDLQCPVEPGTYRVGHTVELPREIPPGMQFSTSLCEPSDLPLAKFDVNLRGYSLDDDDLTCIDLWIDFKQT